MPVSNSFLASKWFTPIACAAPMIIALAVPYEENVFVPDHATVDIKEQISPPPSKPVQGCVAESISTYKQSDAGERLMLSAVPYTLGMAGILGISLTRARFWKGNVAIDAMTKHAAAYLLARFHIRDGLPIRSEQQAKTAKHAITCLQECMSILEQNNLTQVEEVWSALKLVYPKELYGECQKWIPILQNHIAKFEQRQTCDTALSEQQELARYYDLFELAKGGQYSLPRLQASFHLAARKICSELRADLPAARTALADLRIAFETLCRDQGHDASYNDLTGAFLAFH